MTKLAFATLFASVTSFSGCSKDEAATELKEAESAVEASAKEVAEDVGAVVEEGEKMASELGEKAQAYLAPLKDKLGNLEELKETPEQLKTAVAEMIASIEQRAEDLKLPESVSTALANVKEKLIALRDYLEGEVEQAKVDEHIQEIMESAKSGLGLSQE
ncbi:hypothetical protein [Novipirellula artificiosorum]|nr:hypothetical protein [Novipirellula artificiosorum]